MNVCKIPFYFARRYLNVSHRSLSNKIADQCQDAKKYDIVIAGGGLVGCALACAIGTSPVLSDKKILLLESSPKKKYSIDPENYSNRVISINDGTVSLFKKIGIWEKICNVRIKEAKKMHVWECCSDATLTFQHPEMKNTLAYIVENNLVLQMLDECLSSLKDRVEVLWESKATFCDLPSADASVYGYPTLTFPDGSRVQSKLLVGADGTNSDVRKAMKVKYIHCSYNQKGIVANLKLAEPTENVVMWQRFLPSGIIALLPVTDDMCSLVWSVSQDVCDILMNQSEEEFVDSLNTYLWSSEYKIPTADSIVSAFKEALLNIFPGKSPIKQLPPSILSIVPGSRASFPLGLGHSCQYVSPRVALIGDSAHHIHPLAGQGVNLGFGDVQCLIDCLEQSTYRGNEIGSFDALLEYEKQRQRHVVPFLIFTDALNRLYKTDFMPSVVTRSLGVTLLDSMDWMKTQIMKHASS